MTRRFLSLLCALALCLGLTPATALAADNDKPNNLYVGNQNVKSGEDTTYWATTVSGELELVEGASDTSNNWNVKYEPNSATLTLRNATIKTTHNSGKSAVIYAQSVGSSAVSLTIELEGTNTIVCDSALYGIYVNAEMSNESYGTDASLTITGKGSLDVSGSSYGIWVKSGSGNASLTIENASVVANTTSSYGVSGVCVQSGTRSKDSPKLSLIVNGGSLTTSGSASGKGIQFHAGAYEVNSATTSLTVTGNAIVDARTGGISASGVNVTPELNIRSTDSTGGIVFDGTEGTVYGDVTLDESLTIGEDETLTIPQGSTLNTNSNLTNNGTIVNKGTLEGKLTGDTGTIVNAPAITDQPNNATVTVGQTATFTVAASGENLSFQWQQSADNGTNWNNISGATSNSYTTDAATLEMNNYQYQCVVSNSAGSVTSSAATLTVNAATVPVTGVTLDKNALSLTVGGTETLTATVEPDTATNKAVAWKSSNPDVATVSNGVVTAKATGTATITVTTKDGSHTATCAVTVTQPVTGVTLDQAELSLYIGESKSLTATVQPDSATNKNVTWSSDKPDVATVDGNGKVTAVSPGTATITATAADGGKTATCTVTVMRYVPPAPAKTPSQQALDKIESADDGDTVTVSLPAGDTVLDAEVFEALAGRDVTLEAKLPGGAVWAVSGLDVPEGAELADLDMGVTMGVDAIPADVVNAVTGEAGTVQLALAHDGPFGFEMTLTTSVGAENAGLWANLYRYDEAAGRLVFQASARVGEDGGVALPFDHASQYAIVLDAVSHELPFSDVSPSDWFANPVGTAFRAGLMVGYDDSSLFGPEDELTRAQAATVLCRALGAGAQSPACGMADVDPGAWYAGSVDWAVSSGLMVGYGDGSGLFGPDDALTREQLAVVLWRAAGSPDAGSYDGSAFSDGAGASQWAEPALAWAVESGVLKGSDDGAGGTELRPTEAVTRAEMATMLARWIRSE